MGSNNAEPVKPIEVVLPPEELAILMERLATIDDAVSLEELLAELDEDLKAEDAAL